MYAVGLRVVRLSACVILFLWSSAFGQGIDTLSSVMLEPVEVSGTWLHNYAIGSHSEAIDSVTISLHKASSLSQLLQYSQGIYLKEYGPGMLSSISLRGTSASHTALLWNGLPINYPSLGQADFAVIPAFFVDKAEVFYGGVSPLAGSGAIGGAIALSDEVPQQQLAVDATTEVASFGTVMSGLKSTVSGAGTGLSLAAFFKESENDYTYRNRTKAGQPTERQSHGAFAGRGIKVGSFWKPWRQGMFDLNGWFTRYYREIIPPMTVPVGGDRQTDQSARLSFGYAHQFSPQVKLESKLGHIEDQIQFNGLSSTTTQYMLNTNLEWQVGNSLQLRGGTLLNHIAADVPEYGGGLSENRPDFYLLANWFLSHGWEVSTKMRKGLVGQDWTPWSPSLGVTSAIMQAGSGYLKWRGQVSGSYRAPTLNDRHWSPGGNIDLKAENGWSVESGLDYEWSGSNGQLTTSLTGYGHWINDWILWLPQPQGYWSPVNVRKVFSRGAELSVDHLWGSHNFSVHSKLNYKLTFSEVRKGYSGDENNLGNQLPYVPFHQASLSSRVVYRKWQLGPTVRYFGDRFTLIDNDVSLSGYAVCDIEVSREFRIGRSAFSALARVNNLLNARYENLQYRPMPGRSYALQLNYTFKQNRK